MAKGKLNCTKKVMERTLLVLQRKQLPTVSPILRIDIHVLKSLRPAKDNSFDVVLVDTAGRMQDNEVCSELNI